MRNSKKDRTKPLHHVRNGTDTRGPKRPRPPVWGNSGPSYPTLRFSHKASNSERIILEIKP